jgi:hypothetical protein
MFRANKPPDAQGVKEFCEKARQWFARIELAAKCPVSWTHLTSFEGKGPSAYGICAFDAGTRGTGKCPDRVIFRRIAWR